MVLTSRIQNALETRFMKAEHINSIYEEFEDGCFTLYVDSYGLFDEGFTFFSFFTSEQGEFTAKLDEAKLFDYCLDFEETRAYFHVTDIQREEYCIAVRFKVFEKKIISYKVQSFTNLEECCKWKSLIM